MESTVVWITPLLMLPGIATLVISTAARYAALYEEIHRMFHQREESQLIEGAHLMTRAVHFRNALVAQYAGVLLMVCASLIGALFEVAQLPGGDTWVLIVLAAGVTVIAYSTVELVRESRFSLEVIRLHMREIQSAQEK